MKATLDEYLGAKGLSSPISDYMIDKMRIPHGQTEKQAKAMERDARRAAEEYHADRQAAIAEYHAKVATGEIVGKTALEQRIEAANGHPDNESTQAARRILERRGIEWREAE